MTELWVCAECKLETSCYCRTYDSEKYPPTCHRKFDSAKWKRVNILRIEPEDWLSGAAPKEERE